MTPQSVLDASNLVGRAVARGAGESDAIDGMRPRVVVEPGSAEALAALLAWASGERLTVVLRGNGTKLGWGRRPAAIDLVVGTRRLNRVIAHQHGDLTATVEGGATIAEINRALAAHGQWLPVDVPFDDATIGGTIAAGDSGPIRHRHGTPRDLLIGVHLATTDGRVVKSGGNVVKNVAGYDLGKLMNGSFGQLAAIASATFKLAPLPAASGTVMAAFADSDALARGVAAMTSSQLEPVALDLHVFVPPQASNAAASAAWREPSYQLLAQFASTPDSVRAQIDEATRLLSAGAPTTISGTAEADAWRGHRDLMWGAPGAVVKISWLPSSLALVLAHLEAISRRGTMSIGFVGRAAVGVGYVRIDADVPPQVDAIGQLRSSESVRHVVVQRAEPSVKEQADVWGQPPDTMPLLRSVKRAFDAAGILGAGRGPI